MAYSDFTHFQITSINGSFSLQRKEEEEDVDVVPTSDLEEGIDPVWYGRDVKITVKKKNNWIPSSPAGNFTVKYKKVQEELGETISEEDSVIDVNLIPNLEIEGSVSVFNGIMDYSEEKPLNEMFTVNKAINAFRILRTEDFYGQLSQGDFTDVNIVFSGEVLPLVRLSEFKYKAAYFNNSSDVIKIEFYDGHNNIIESEVNIVVGDGVLTSTTSGSDTPKEYVQYFGARDKDLNPLEEEVTMASSEGIAEFETKGFDFSKKYRIITYVSPTTPIENGYYNEFEANGDRSEGIRITQLTKDGYLRPPGTVFLEYLEKLKPSEVPEEFSKQTSIYIQASTVRLFIESGFKSNDVKIAVNQIISELDSNDEYIKVLENFSVISLDASEPPYDWEYPTDDDETEESLNPQYFDQDSDDYMKNYDNIYHTP